MRLPLLLLIAACTVGHPWGNDDSPGLTKLRTFVAVLNSRDQSKMEEFIRANGSPNSGNKRPISDRATHLLELAKLGTPFTIGKILRDEQAEVVTELRSSTGEGWEIKMSFDADEPHKVLSIYVGVPGTQLSPPPKKYTGWKDLPDLLTQIKADTNIPALGIAFSKDGKVQTALVGERETHKPGKANIEDHWLIGSITKSMTATMIARLIDRGVMRWDTTIAEALPHTPMRPEYRNVTVLQLLQHRSGVQQDKYVTDKFLKDAAGDSTDLVAIREHYTQFTLARDPIGKPGEKMAYSNAGYSIAAHMAETLAKQPYEELMQDLVFKPLGMSGARMGVPGTRGNPGYPGELNGHVYEGKILVAHVIDDPKLNGIQAAAGAGVSMTLSDLLNFAQFHLAGLRGHVTLMSAKNFAILHTPGGDGSDSSKYACGWVIDDTTTKETIHGHNGSDGTFFAEMAIWPKQNFAAIAISNAANNQSQSPPLQAIFAVYNRLASGQ